MIPPAHTLIHAEPECRERGHPIARAVVGPGGDTLEYCRLCSARWREAFRRTGSSEGADRALALFRTVDDALDG